MTFRFFPGKSPMQTRPEHRLRKFADPRARTCARVGLLRLARFAAGEGPARLARVREHAPALRSQLSQLSGSALCRAKR